MKEKKIYKILFHNQGKVYEVYARHVHPSAMLGFIEVENFVFGERSAVVVDPAEESLKAEFKGVERSYIPLHSVIRIDEAQKQGTARITETGGKDKKVMPFPLYTQSGNDIDSGK